MRDTVRHVVVDTSVLAAAFVPSSTDSQVVRDVIDGIFACSQSGWPAIRLYVPAICVAKTLGVFDKLRFKDRTLGQTEYAVARSALERFVGDRHYHQLDQQPRHVFATGLVSPINYSLSGRQGRHMGAADCLVAGMAVLLGHQVGVEDVLLLTADSHMAKVMARAAQLTATEADGMGIADIAAKVGVSPWSPGIYPGCLNVRETQEAQLREAFLGWPLPSSPCRGREATGPEDKAAIWALYQTIRREHGFRGREKLLSSPALDELRTRIACQRGLNLSAAQVYEVVAAVEKSPTLRRRLTRLTPERVPHRLENPTAAR
jgi:hypothetical protein